MISCRVHRRIAIAAWTLSWNERHRTRRYGLGGVRVAQLRPTTLAQRSLPRVFLQLTVGGCHAGNVVVADLANCTGERGAVERAL